MNETQLQALIDAAVQKAVADTQAALAPMLAAADAKNKGLLADLKKAQGKPEPADKKRETLAEALARIDAETDALLAQVDTKDYAAEWQKDRAKSKVVADRAIDGLKIDLNDAVIFDRAHPKAGDASYYRQVKAAAEARGVPMRVIDSREENTSPVQIARPTFDLKGVRYVAASELEGQRMSFYQQAEREGKRVVVFKDPSQLNPDARAVHDAPDGAK